MLPRVVQNAPISPVIRVPWATCAIYHAGHIVSSIALLSNAMPSGSILHNSASRSPSCIQHHPSLSTPFCIHPTTSEGHATSRGTGLSLWGGTGEAT